MVAKTTVHASLLGHMFDPVDIGRLKMSGSGLEALEGLAACTLRYQDHP